jgi:hypothetical protein
MPEPTRGEQLRAAIEADYNIDGAPAQSLLEAIVATANELEQLEEAVADHGVLIDGARGNSVANPALAAIVKHRSLLARLIHEAFPDAASETTTEKQRRAARARWDKA